MKPDKEIELTETSRGRWEIAQPWHHTVNNIPRLGSPVEFFAIIGAILLISYLI